MEKIWQENRKQWQSTTCEDTKENKKDKEIANFLEDQKK